MGTVLFYLGIAGGTVGAVMMLCRHCDNLLIVLLITIAIMAIGVIGGGLAARKLGIFPFNGTLA